jgi:hypothetical protein
MRRVALAFALASLLVLALLCSSQRTWAAPWMDPLRQTVPTRTPTSAPRTPGPAAPTEEAGDTPAPPPPTGTAEAMPTPTSTVAAEASRTPAPRESSSPTLLPTTLSEGGSWDFGDAPDPGFPSLAASNGARHSVISFEWLGEDVDDESDSRQIDRDLYDDGVASGELNACSQQALEAEIRVQSRENPDHPYDAQHLLYLNVLVDWNGDGSWSGAVHCPQGVAASEWAVRNLPIDVSSWPDGALSNLESIVLTTGPLTGQVWARFSLSYAEVVSGDDWDGRGTFAYGETEDYAISVSLPPTAILEVGKPASATTTPSPVGSITAVGGPAGPASWRHLLCLGGGALLFGLALVLVILALKARSRPLLIGAFVVAVVLLAVLIVLYKSSLSQAGLSANPGLDGVVPTPRERLVPTAAEVTGPPAVSGAPSPTAVPTWASTPEPEQTNGEAAPSTSQSGVATPLPSLYSTGDRFGFGVAVSGVEHYDVDQLHAGWYLDWSHDADPARPHGMEYVQMVNVRGGSAVPGSQDLESIARLNPGSLWLIGNEPDVVWQDGLTPTEYARVYHDVYELLKSADPSCQVAIGGVSQPTPLRLQYLDMILDAYKDLYDQTMPVDVWNVHNFILREERGSWGVDIPPGISVDQGRLFEIQDHDSLEIFRQQILDFRQWMKDRGERDKPLVVTEYGIVMPSEYGFSLERVRDFMYATFDFLMTATDPELGYPPDDDRLVQRWCWYSLSDTVYPTGNLFDPGSGQITPLGLAYGSYIVSH